MKSDRSAEVLHHFGLGRTIGFYKGFSHAIHSEEPVLHTLLPGSTDVKCHHRLRRHNLAMSIKNSSIVESDFVTRSIFKDVYWHLKYSDIFCTYLHSNSSRRLIRLLVYCLPV